MPIKWSTLKVIEAMDTVEGYINQAIEPLEQARTITREARNIQNLPQYVDQYLIRIIGEIDRVIGGSQWEPEGRLKAAIQSVRESLPEKAIEEEKKRVDNGIQSVLVE